MKLCRVGLLILVIADGSGAAAAQTIHRDGFEESCFVDSDVDRLPNCEEVNRSLDYFDQDTDDDGLTDGDEVLGTIGGLDLPACAGPDSGFPAGRRCSGARRDGAGNLFASTG